MDFEMIDNYGRRLDCHFLAIHPKNTYCPVLKSFYNDTDYCNLCKNCPFFKTDEEFMAGWKRRRPKNGDDGLQTAL